MPTAAWWRSPSAASAPGSHLARTGNHMRALQPIVHIGTAAMLALSAGLFGEAPAAAQAQTFPNHVVRLIVPFPPGGATDALARNMAERLAERWKQPVVIENKP